MEIPTMFLSRLLNNLAVITDTVVERDVQAIEHRYKHEGMSFLTITLPSLCDALDKGLATGRMQPSDFQGFAPLGREGSLPRFLSGFFLRVFALDGSLLERPCIDSIAAIRQVTRLFKKVELPCSSARLAAAYERYVTNDEECQEDLQADPLRIRLVAGHLWSCLETLSDRIYLSHGVFGNGATAERLGRNARLSVKSWPIRGEEYFPLTQHCLSREDDLDTIQTIDLLEVDRELPVRVVSVPKTLKTPRIISVEPSHMMLRQQQVARVLMDFLENDHKFRGSIRFSDQTVNRDRARLGSIDGGLATIDLSDASDRVSNALVKHIFEVAPTFLGFAQAARSNTAKVPGHGVKVLRKYASQGSALCFPIEAMVFYTIVVASILHYRGESPTTKRIADISAKVSVYGDDIIVPSETAEAVMSALELYGLKVNKNKSFHTGLFRESCGGDYYAGHDVTPVYVRQWSDSFNYKSAKYVVSTISLANQFYLKGYWNVVQHIRNHVEKRLGHLARTTKAIGCLTWVSCCYNTNLKWDRELHVFRTKGPVVKLKHDRDSFHDIRGALNYSFQRQAEGNRIQQPPVPGLRAHHELGERDLGVDASRREAVNNSSFGDRDGSERQRWRNNSLPSSNTSLLEEVLSFKWGGRESNPLAEYQPPKTLGQKDPELVIDPYASGIKRRWVSVNHATVW